MGRADQGEAKTNISHVVREATLIYGVRHTIYDVYLHIKTETFDSHTRST